MTEPGESNGHLQAESVETMLDPAQYGVMVDEIQSKKHGGNKKLYLSGKTISGVMTVGDSTYRVAAVGPKTVAGISENNQLTDPPGCSTMGPFFFGDSSTLRDWEQNRKEPDAAARAYLIVIARNPEAVSEALQPQSS